MRQGGSLNVFYTKIHFQRVFLIRNCRLFFCSGAKNKWARPTQSVFRYANFKRPYYTDLKETAAQKRYIQNICR